MTPEDNDDGLVGSPTNRLEALVDGVFAVAMTILVLDLHLPELGAHVTDGLLLEALEDHLPQILAFASGFLILGTLWVGHRYQFHYIRSSSRALAWINIGFLLTISFLPFVIGLIGTYGPMRVTCILYGGTLVLAMTWLLVQWLYAAAPRRHLVSRTLPPVVFAGLRNRVLMGMIGYGGGTLLALVSPRASLGCYVMMPLLYLLPGRFNRHVRTEPSAD